LVKYDQNEIMSTVTTYEAKTGLSGLIEQVANGGEDVIITRHGTPVAKLVPMDRPSWQPVFTPMPPELRPRLREGEDIAPVFPEGFPGHPGDPV